jgi:hypothetical protein
MHSNYGQWPVLVAAAAGISTAAVELSALSEPELPSLVDFLLDGPPLPFLYVSVHAPSKARQVTEDDLVDMLLRLTQRVDAIVMHPDVIDEPSGYRALRSTLVLENTDNRKVLGQTAADLAPYFDELPQAGLCFDVAHAASVDPTLTVAQELLDVHGHRLRHVHLSSLDEDSHHRSLTPADKLRFTPLLDRCRDVPWILEAAPE